MFGGALVTVSLGSLHHELCGIRGPDRVSESFVAMFSHLSVDSHSIFCFCFALPGVIPELSWVPGLTHSMVQEALPDLKPPPWEPCAKDMEALVHTTGKLFIIAWTAILFILDDKRYNPQSQVEKLLQGVASDYSGRRIDALDDVYIQILQSAIPENSIEIVEHF